jgi:pantothenate kinase-related protein Tda10
LDIPNVDITKMNRDQKFAFQIALKTIQTFIFHENPTNYEPLRMIVSGTAGSGKSYLIKCLVKAVRTIFSSNRAWSKILSIFNPITTHELHPT